MCELDPPVPSRQCRPNPPSPLWIMPGLSPPPRGAAVGPPRRRTLARTHGEWMTETHAKPYHTLALWCAAIVIAHSRSLAPALPPKNTAAAQSTN
jgi:hypothetical protein